MQNEKNVDRVNAKRFMTYKSASDPLTIRVGERNISFEKIIFHLLQGNIWKIADHPNRKNHPGQKRFTVSSTSCHFDDRWKVETPDSADLDISGYEALW